MPNTLSVLNLSNKIGSRDAELIDLDFKQLLIEIKDNPQLKILKLRSNRLENRHFPLLLEALKSHKCLINIDLSYNFLVEFNPDLSAFVSTLVRNNPDLKEIFLEACRIDDIEFKKIISTLSPYALSNIYIDFSRNKLTSISADLAIEKKVNLGTLDRLLFNNNLKKGNENIIEIVKEILEGDNNKKSPVLTAYYELHSTQRYNANNNIEREFSNLKLIK